MKRPRLDDYEVEAPTLHIGSHTAFTEIPKADVREKQIIGFIRPKKKRGRPKKKK